MGVQVLEEIRDGFAEEEILNEDLKHGTGFGVRQIWVQNLSVGLKLLNEDTLPTLQNYYNEKFKIGMAQCLALSRSSISICWVDK